MTFWRRSEDIRRKQGYYKREGGRGEKKERGVERERREESREEGRGRGRRGERRGREEREEEERYGRSICHFTEIYENEIRI